MKNTFLLLLTLWAFTLQAQTTDSLFTQKQKSCIQSIIQQDEVLGGIRNHACEDTTLSSTILAYVEGMEALNFENCPKAFTEAFQKHIDAWRDMITVMDKYPGLRGEMHDLFKQLEEGEDAEAFKTKLDAVWDTWSGVEAAMK